LPSQALFDDNWKARKLLLLMAAGTGQYARYQALLPALQNFSQQPTPAFVEKMRQIDQRLAQGMFWNLATSLTKARLSRDELLQGGYYFRTWRFQECDDLGVFISPDGPESIFPALGEYKQECAAIFNINLSERWRPWMPGKWIDRLSVPMIYVGAGKDPWAPMGLAPPPGVSPTDTSVTPTSYGKYVYVPQGFHGPDRDDSNLAVTLLNEMLEALSEPSPILSGDAPNAAHSP